MVSSVPEQSSASLTSSRHPVQECENLLSCIRLLDVANFRHLGDLLPRAQDVPAERFGRPSSASDQVISVSHAWRNQAHPDPACQKVKLLGQLLSEIRRENGQHQSQSLFLFLDFISIPQRPFHPDQQQRSEEEMDMFKKALGCMHEMYFYSDRIIHLPWEDVDVPGEGVEEMVLPEALQGAEFLEIGECVQVIRMQGIAQEVCKTNKSCRQQRVHLFDQVVSVNGQIVKSVAQLECLLADDPKIATLRRYPFGKYSEIPADSRGWVFLERFITMVKCAMMDEDSAGCVVVTPSSAIRQQILSGASILRDASRLEAKHSQEGALKRALEGFIVELRSKQFSAASTDKRELAQSQATTDDREVVIGIMQHFVEHLAVHWEAEAHKQRSLAARLTTIAKEAETYLVEWESFSEEYAAKLEEAATANPWPVAVLVTVPLAHGLPLLLWPYVDPGGGWSAQAEYWVIGIPLLCFPVFLGFVVLLAETARVLLSWPVLLLFVAWAALCTTASVVVVIGIASALDIFPVPFTHMLGVATLGSFLPLLWWIIPKAQRASTQFRRQFCSSMLALNVTLGLYGVGIPLLNATIPLVSSQWHFVLLSSYLGLKLAFEFLGIKMSKILGADVIPYFIFFATLAYQANLCVAFSKVTSWVLVVQQICFDLLENCYHLYSLFRLDPSASASMRMGQYITASLALRQFVELITPALFLLLYVAIKNFRPRSNGLLCDRSESEVRRTVYFLLADIAVELAASCVTYLILVKMKQYRPLLLLRGLIATRLLCFCLITTGLVTYVAMLHSHWGNDFSFRFTWLGDSGAVWDCGLTWHAPSEVAV